MTAAVPPTLGPQAFCFACGVQIDARAEICPKCGVRQARKTSTTVAVGKDRVVAIVLALVLGGLGIHKFYLGKTAQGVIYLVLSWTGIPSLIAWIEGILYLRTSNAAWAAQYGGEVKSPSSTAVGCLWLVALVPLLGILAIVGLIVLGSQVSTVLR